MRADAAATTLVQSLRAHAKKLPRAGTWQQLLNLGAPGLPPEAVDVYLATLDALKGPMDGHPPNQTTSDGCEWVPATKWKSLLAGGPFADAFDTTRRVMLLRTVSRGPKGAPATTTTVATPWWCRSQHGVLAHVLASWQGHCAHHHQVTSPWQNHAMTGLQVSSFRF